VPRSGFWREAINTNSEFYGGSGEGNGGGRAAQDVPWDGYNHSLELTLPATSTTIFKWQKS
jgi:1,4-alpha-glucan branching enzyme